MYNYLFKSLLECRVRATVLGSRAQMCVNQRVQLLSGTAQRVACDNEVSNDSCKYYNSRTRFTDASDRLSGVPDIEDLVQRGRAMNVCAMEAVNTTDPFCRYAIPKIIHFYYAA